MDVKHRTAYARIKQIGVADPVMLNDGLSLVQLLPAIGRALSQMPSRYQGLTIEIEFSPIVENLTSNESAMKELMAGLDMSLVTQESDEEANLWANSPINPDSSTFDPLLREYNHCGYTPYRERKTPEDLSMLRKHVESKYRNTTHWAGFHKW